MKSFLLAALVLLLSVPAHAATLPGFRVERLGSTEGFPTSIAIDSAGRIYYSTTAGAIHRFNGISSTRVASVPTDGTGNSGLLGMALRDDHTAIVHYTTPQQTHDVLSSIDLRDGTESVIHRFIGDVELPGRPTPTEHHGGNPSIAPDGSIFVGIGDYSWSFIAPNPDWNGGKIFRISPSGTITQFARGLRNPFDMAWDDARKKLILADNGPTRGDEIHIIDEGADCGWPYTYGTLPPVAGAVVPDYVFPETTAPTGVILLDGRTEHMRRGFLVGGFVSRSIDYFDRTAPPLAAPFRLIERETAPVIDLAQTADGQIYFVTGGFSPGASGIYRLRTPRRGDCNGDGKLTRADYETLTAVLATGVLQPATAVHKSVQNASWGCDADEDGFVGPADATALLQMLPVRRRAAAR